MAAANLGRPIQGILHASGVLHDALIRQQSPALVREVYAAKVAGCHALVMVSFQLHALQTATFHSYMLTSTAW